MCDDDECGVMQNSGVLKYGLGVRDKEGCKLSNAQSKFKNMGVDFGAGKGVEKEEERSCKEG